MNTTILRIMKAIKLFMLDLDGTLYRGIIPIEGAVTFVKAIRASQRRVVFFTNNASKTPEAYIEKLSLLGFEPGQDEVMTSGDVTIEYLCSQRKGEKVFCLGTPSLLDSLEKAGVPLATIGEEADIVLSSFDLTLTYEKLVHACDLLRNGAAFLSTHPDINCPTETGFIPDCGAINALLTASTGKTPRSFGKPNAETAAYIAKKSRLSSREIAMVGDRMYTDIALGKRHGLWAILVLSGETREKDLVQTPRNEFPDLIFPSVKEIIPYL
ncbi:MAG TPA: HAD family hydrolase [Clostridiales bacterium]|nr:HAD family hydrolase [Clostridiales bacterium]HCG35319.1 HAD family hydrolase [Clostridiales bacterium]